MSKPARNTPANGTELGDSEPVAADRGSTAYDTSEPWSAEHWARHLTAELGYPVEVTYTRARRQVVQSRWRGKTAELRLSRIFATAPAPVRADFLRWMQVGRRARKACERLDAWIEEAVREMAPARRPTVRGSGRVHDLDRLAAELLAGELQGEERLSEPPAITWGRRTRQARHSLRLGSYTAPERLVRIHPVLDQEGVPDWFVRYIVFHELLHVVLPPRPSSGRRLLRHPPEFRAREREYPDYDRAIAWQEQNLGALLRSARSGRDMAGAKRRPSAPPAKEPQESPTPGDQEPAGDARNPRRLSGWLAQLKLWPDS